MLLSSRGEIMPINRLTNRDNRASTVLTMLLLASGIALMPPVAQAEMPSTKVCTDKENPPKDNVTVGGCLAQDQKMGNCLACHVIPGGTLPGNVGPPLIGMQQRFPDKSKLRAQIWDATVANPHSVMPPFGRNKILSDSEIDKIVEFLYTI
jgi:sulfur-oxidizing protein SoxX